MDIARHNTVERVVMILIAAVVVLAPFIGGRLVIYSLTITALYAMVVISLNIVLGLAGQVSFAQTAFMAIGGYGSAVLTTKLGVNPLLALAASAILAFAASLIIGAPLLRLRGHYLAMATFALALGTNSFVTAATPLTNGSVGISGVPPLAIGTFALNGALPFYVLSWAACGIALAIFALLARSHLGRAWRALATGQEIAISLGINITRAKLTAFAIAAVIASVAGSLYVEFTSFAGPDLYDVSVVLNVLLMLFIGGRGSYAGPIVGAALLTFAPQVLAGLEKYQSLVFFVVLLALIVLWPSGFFGRTGETAPLSEMLPAWLRRREPAH